MDHSTATRSVVAALLSQLFLLVGIAQAADHAPAIRLSSRVIDTSSSSSKSVAATLLPAGARHVLLQFHRIPDEAARQQLAGAGIHLLEYVPDHAWLATVEHRGSLKRAPAGLIRWVGTLQPQDRLSPALRSSGVGHWAAAGDGSITLRAAFFKDVRWDAIAAVVARHGAELAGGSDRANLVLRLPGVASIQRLAGEDVVQWIDNGPAPRHPRDTSNGGPARHAIAKNDAARALTRVNALQTALPSANGSGTRLAVFDGGVDITHPDFAGRITRDPDHSQPSDDHGTHVAGTMAGDGSNSDQHGGTANQYRGVATAAQVFSFDNNTNGAMKDFFASHEDAIVTANADLSQNSWGGNFTSQNCDTHNVYSVDSQNMDKIVTGEAYVRGIVVSVAASNFRDGTSDDTNDQSPICNFAGAPDFINYTSLSDLGSAKNILSVGATQKVATSRMADFSSWGPTRDGRLKPDIVAPGDGIQSTIPGGGYGPQSGTSMATPHISGIAALAIQRYRQVFNNDSARPATIRAILIQSAQDLQADHVYYTPGPDFASGYGLADAEAAYVAVAVDRVLQRAIANGATDVLSMAVGAGEPELKVTLSWDDPAPALNAATQLVNNLDLELVAPNGATLHLPWLLDPQAPADAATRGIDSLNNTEQVQVANPAAGTWTLRVKGTAVPTGPQQYSLASSHAVQGGVVGLEIFRNGFEP